jgi:hypothetical protein
MDAEYAAAAHLDMVHEDARRLHGCAVAYAAEIEATAGLEAVQATEEAAAMLEMAEIAAHQLTAAAEQEADALNRRLAQLRTAVRQAEDYYREVAPEAAERAALAGDLIDLDLTGLVGFDESEVIEGSESEVDLTESTPEPVEATNPTEAGEPNGDAAFVDAPREPDFYRRRLAGLRERLEHSTPSD